ncbi:MAG: HlyD family efflux transporter periplasmic adaptor subunit [Acidobacteria bacterium]|nr:HlyD family efflux transporter periplasmic adaptor subunit [Acidobacteriota bacterium]
MNNPLTLLRTRSRRAGLASAGAMAVLATVVLPITHEPDPAWPTATARQGLFEEVIVESGTISAARLMLYSAPLGPTAAKIVELAPEGVPVAAGDVLVRFDTSVLDQMLEKEEASLRLAQAEVIRATEDLRLEHLGAQAELDAASQQAELAERELTNQLEGKGRLELAEAEAAAAEAAREVERARTTLEDMRPLLAEGFVTRAEVERADQALARAEEQRDLRRLKLDAVKRHERPTAVAKSTSDVSAARQAIKRTGEATAARIAQRQAALAAAEGRVAEITARANSLRQQLARTAIRAEGPGLVVYRDLFFGSDRRKPQVGDEVFPNQPLIALPDSSHLVVETRVREVDLHKVSASQHVRVKVEAYPELTLPASVVLVGALAQEDPTRAGTKFFPVTIKLLAADPRLRTGMTTQVVIQVLSIPNATSVPADAVFEKLGRRYCFVLQRGRPERRAVAVTAENETAVVIRSGIAPGETVLLADPGDGY